MSVIISYGTSPKLNGTPIKRPIGGIGIESYNLTKSGRVASGKMTMELVAKKRKFTFKYDVLNGHDLQTILDIIDGTAMFFTLDYIDNGFAKTATVYVGGIKKQEYRGTGDGCSVWYWKEVTFDLIEQ